jgi:hypothetical protein
MDFAQTHLHDLQAEGYFVSIFGNGSEPGTLIVDCKINLMDTAEDGSPTKPFCFDPLTQSPRDPEGACICCEGTHERQWTKGSVMCPLCLEWTKPWSITQRLFRGIFKIVPGDPAILIPQTIEPPFSMKWMSADSDYAKQISERLNHYDVLNLFTKSEKQAAGWLMCDQQAASLMAMQERMRAEEAAEEAAHIEESKAVSLSFTDEDFYADMPALIPLEEGV